LTQGAADPISVEAPAKLNLYLHVTGRRADGYHELDSLVAFADLHDTVAVRPADRLTLAVEGRFADALKGDADNLVLRAARALAAAANVEPRAALTLIKRLPVAAGIGGGSADAAAALIALSALWSVALAPAARDALALKLGADVPVCLAGRPAFVGGIGERLDDAPALPPVALVLANPLRGLPTPAVFGARTGPFDAPARFEQAPKDAAALAALLARRGNALTAAAMALEPEVGTVLRALEDAPGALIARMSGSGASCFALFAAAGEARAAAATLGAAHPGWWVEAGRIL